MKNGEKEKMNKNQFDVVYPIICSAVIEKMVTELNMSDTEAIAELYSSHLYELLEQEKSKLWQYSTDKLFELFLEEKNSGKINFPQI